MAKKTSGKRNSRESWAEQALVRVKALLETAQRAAPVPDPKTRLIYIEGGLAGAIQAHRAMMLEEAAELLLVSQEAYRAGNRAGARKANERRRQKSIPRKIKFLSEVESLARELQRKHLYSDRTAGKNAREQVRTRPEWNLSDEQAKELVREARKAQAVASR